MNLIQSAVVFTQSLEGTVQNFAPHKPGLVGAIDLERLQPNVFDPEIYQFERKLGDPNGIIFGEAEKGLLFKNKIIIYADPIRVSLLNDNPKSIGTKEFIALAKNLTGYLSKVKINGIGINFTYHGEQALHKKVRLKFLKELGDIEKSLSEFAITYSIDIGEKTKMNCNINGSPFDLLSGGRLEGLIVSYNFHKSFPASSGTTDREQYIKTMADKQLSAEKNLNLILK